MGDNVVAFVPQPDDRVSKYMIMVVFVITVTALLKGGW